MSFNVNIFFARQGRQYNISNMMPFQRSASTISLPQTTGYRYNNNAMAAGPLHGTNILDLTHYIAGPFATKLLADAGANVIKVEHPHHGDPVRWIGPFAHDDPHPEKSLLFLYLNTNKRSITLNLKTEGGKRILRALIDWADVMIENFSPRVLPSLGLDYQSLSEFKQSLIVTSISNFGQSGPYRDHKTTELISQAVGGLMYTAGDSDKSPLHHGLHQAQYTAGMNGAAATLGALYHRIMNGVGCHVDISIQECVAAAMVQAFAQYVARGGIPGRLPPNGKIIDNVAPCRDGYVVPSVQGPIPFEVLADLLGVEELKDVRFATPEGRIRHGAEVDHFLLQGLSQWDRYPLFHAANELRFAFGVIQTPEDLYHCPQLGEREYFSEVEHPKAGIACYPGRIIELSATPFRKPSAAPLLGQHNQEVYTGMMDYSASELIQLREMDII